LIAWGNPGPCDEWKVYRRGENGQLKGRQLKGQTSQQSLHSHVQAITILLFGLIFWGVYSILTFGLITLVLLMSRTSPPKRNIGMGPYAIPNSHMWKNKQSSPLWCLPVRIPVARFKVGRQSHGRASSAAFTRARVNGT
jgi:hypothetical protein